MPTLEIDGQKVTVEDGQNLVQAAETLGIEIPHYCYHPGLSVAGNCRMCLVEIEKMPKLQIACNTRATEGMVVRTQNERVKEVRATVLEFLLVNHPIDCPICDQAGECKLQDYYMDYDRNESRIPVEAKVKKGKAKDIGTYVMLDQERCILCTRCTRFLDEVTHTSELGLFQRGDHTRIDLVPEHRLENKYSGNVVDICPVGALTNKAFRFRSRVWYLDHTRSVCPTCATGCNVDLHHRNGELFRMRPRHNPEVNRYWMCDAGRMSFRKHQGEGRLLQPAVREEAGWSVRSWDQVLNAAQIRLGEIVKESGTAALAGIVSAQATTEEMFLLKKWMGTVLGGRVGGFAWSPVDADFDDFLIDRDKNPNTNGLATLGIDTKNTESILKDAAEGKIRGLVVFRADFGPSHGDSFLDAIADKVEFLVVIDTHFHETGARADLLLPIATFAETDGTFINRKLRIQQIREAFPPTGEAKAGWRLLSELIAASGAGEVPSDASALFSEISVAIKPRRNLTYGAIGEQGVSLTA